MKAVLLLAFALAVAHSQQYAVCNDFSGLFTQTGWDGGNITVSQFLFVDLYGSLNETLLEGDLQIRLTASNTGLLIDDVEGVELCLTGQKGHNICQQPPGDVIFQPQFFWSYLFPSGPYVLSFEAFGDTPQGAHQAVLCGELSFTWDAETKTMSDGPKKA